MIIFPAIDIKDGKVVRLAQGEFDKVTQYSEDPIAMAKHWESQGARWLHVVDLDGAMEGKLKNSDIVLEIVKAVNIPVQTGGGIRANEDITKLLDGGVDRVILGTKAIEDLNFLKKAIRKWTDKIALSLDCRKGYIAQRGWIETTPISAIELVKDLEAMGLQCIVYTDITRDGMLKGPNIKVLEEFLDNTKIPVIASGGISNIDDIANLMNLTTKGVIGAITGRAIYEGKLDLMEAIKFTER